MSAPTITSLNYISGQAIGNVAITITGTKFTPDAIVTFGPYRASDIVVVSSTSITCSTPPAKGLLDVTITEAGGSVTSTGAYTGTPMPAALTCLENGSLNYIRYLYDTPTKSDRDGDSILL